VVRCRIYNYYNYFYRDDRPNRKILRKLAIRTFWATCDEHPRLKRLTINDKRAYIEKALGSALPFDEQEAMHSARDFKYATTLKVGHGGSFPGFIVVVSMALALRRCNPLKMLW